MCISSFLCLSFIFISLSFHAVLKALRGNTDFGLLRVKIFHFFTYLDDFCVISPLMCFSVFTCAVIISHGLFLL